MTTTTDKMFKLFANHWLIGSFASFQDAWTAANARVADGWSWQQLTLLQDGHPHPLG